MGEFCVIGAGDFSVVVTTRSAEISSNADYLLFGPSSGIEIADLPSCTIVDLGTIEESNHEVGIIEVGFAAGEFPLLSMAIVIADMASNLAAEF